MRAQAELDRQQAMMKENATAETTVENWVSQRDQAKAQLELAKINLGYTKVTAPFAGPHRAPARWIPGNLVGSTGADDPRHARAAQADLRQLQPQRARRAAHARPDAAVPASRSGPNVGKAPVEVGLQNEKGYPHVGRPRFRRQRALDLDRDDRPARRLHRTRTRRSSRASSRACAFPWAARGRCSSSPAARSATTSRATSCTSSDADDVVAAARDRARGRSTPSGPRDPQRPRGGRPRHRQRTPERARRREGRAGRRRRRRARRPRRRRSR